MDKYIRMSEFIKHMEYEGYKFNTTEIELVKAVYMNYTILIPRQHSKRSVLNMIAEYEANKTK